MTFRYLTRTVKANIFLFIGIVKLIKTSNPMSALPFALQYLYKTEFVNNVRQTVII